ncbi:MAG: hypothetical protein IPG93_15310 [Burkholderiales bacterium]|nr:hypothetical protein [Burkholderiales bacterium]
MTIHALLTGVPDVIWSGVIASVLTLGGVLLANRSSTTRLRIQLDHESQEKAKQRRAELRRDVYLAVAEESVKANACLAALPNADLSKSDAITPLEGFFSAAAKLQMVANTETALQTSQLVSSYGQLLFRVMALARPIQRAKLSAQLSKQLYEEAQTEIKRILAAMTALNESGSPDPEKFARLGQSFDLYRGQAERHAAEQNEALDQATSLHLQFLKELLPSTKAIGMKTMILMIEIRREFDIESDNLAMENEMRTQWARMEESVDSLLRSIDETSHRYTAK